MISLTVDPLDGFAATFGDEYVELGGENYPIGKFVVDVLCLDDRMIDSVRESVIRIRQRLGTALVERDRESLLDALEQVWIVIDRLPVYHELVQHRSVTGEVPEGPLTAVFDETTEDYQSLMEWLRKLEALPGDVERFRERVTEFVEEYLSGLTQRTPSAYAGAWQSYQLCKSLEGQVAVDEWSDMEGERLQRIRKWDREEFARRTLQTSFDLHTTFVTVPHPNKRDEVILAEQVLIPDLETFLSLDLIRGFGAGHIPRRCDHCGRYFLLDSGYDIRYCDREAPDEPGKTCRQIGAHRKERAAIGSDEVRREYYTAYNRLKMRKNRGTLDPNEWNHLVAQLADLRDAGYRGEVKLAELRERMDAVAPPQSAGRKRK